MEITERGHKFDVPQRSIWVRAKLMRANSSSGVCSGPAPRGRSNSRHLPGGVSCGRWSNCFKGAHVEKEEPPEPFIPGTGFTSMLLFSEHEVIASTGLSLGPALYGPNAKSKKQQL
jgi:hypothetical protein